MDNIRKTKTIDPLNIRTKLNINFLDKGIWSPSKNKLMDNDISLQNFKILYLLLYWSIGREVYFSLSDFDQIKNMRGGRQQKRIKKAIDRLYKKEIEIDDFYVDGQKITYKSKIIESVKIENNQYAIKFDPIFYKANQDQYSIYFDLSFYENNEITARMAEIIMPKLNKNKQWSIYAKNLQDKLGCNYNRISNFIVALKRSVKNLPVDYKIEGGRAKKITFIKAFDTIRTTRSTVKAKENNYENMDLDKEEEIYNKINIQTLTTKELKDIDKRNNEHANVDQKINQTEKRVKIKDAEMTTNENNNQDCVHMDMDEFFKTRAAKVDEFKKQIAMQKKIEQESNQDLTNKIKTAKKELGIIKNDDPTKASEINVEDIFNTTSGKQLTENNNGIPNYSHNVMDEKTFKLWQQRNLEAEDHIYKNMELTAEEIRLCKIPEKVHAIEGIFKILPQKLNMPDIHMTIGNAMTLKPEGYIGYSSLDYAYEKTLYALFKAEKKGEMDKLGGYIYNTAKNNYSDSQFFLEELIKKIKAAKEKREKIKAAKERQSKQQQTTTSKTSKEERINIFKQQYSKMDDETKNNLYNQAKTNRLSEIEQEEIRRDIVMDDRVKQRLILLDYKKLLIDKMNQNGTRVYDFVGDLGFLLS